jgi:hypothetical protein
MNDTRQHTSSTKAQPSGQRSALLPAASCQLLQTAKRQKKKILGY